MRGLRSLGLAASIFAGIGANLMPSRALAGLGPIMLGGGPVGETAEDRRRRNLAAGGRDNRIKRNKARRSLGRIRSTMPRAHRLSNPFTKQARKDRFDAALAAGETRNMAAKLARRVSA